MLPTTSKPAKTHYSESEAAAILGLSVEELRQLIRANILDGDADVTNIAGAVFQPSDLLVLRMILGGFKPPKKMAADKATA